MEKIFGRKLLSEKKDDNSSRTPSGYEITQDDIKKVNLYNKGVNKMAEEKFDDAIRCFDLSIRIDPFFVDALIKKGYSHFHLKQYNLAITIFDRVLEIDINNPEVWNMKGLVFYKSKNTKRL